MDKELEGVLERYLVMERDHHVSWDMLWAFFPSGTQVVYHCDITDDEILGIATETTYGDDQQGPRFLQIQIQMLDYNCNTWSSYQTSGRIGLFDGERGF